METTIYKLHRFKKALSETYEWFKQEKIYLNMQILRNITSDHEPK